MSITGYSQNSITIMVRDHDTREPLPGATVQVRGTAVGGVTNEEGSVLLEGIPSGSYKLVFSFVGYTPVEQSFTFPVTDTGPVVISMEAGEELEEIIVRATRGSRTIEEAPTRMEVISAEELGEKAVMNSSNIAMLLRESTGILMQQTSANSANQSIRIQGLSGRYTQILRDGFPLYGGFSSGLSIMQVPPLDLRQVEVIKGSSSTLYGGGAIAGLVNLVTKTPEEDPVLDVMLNQTSARGTTLNSFYSAKHGKTGTTLYLSGNRQQPYDPNDDGFSDIPKVKSVTVNPRFFWYPDDSTTIWLGVNTTLEDRIGGDLLVLEERPDSLHTFFERNLSRRVSLQLAVDKQFNKVAGLSVRGSGNYFNREISMSSGLFQGRQWAGFLEAAWSLHYDKHDWIMGANLFTDDFVGRQQVLNTISRAYVTPGIFVQDTWELHEKMTLESGMRVDYNTSYGAFVLPRASMLFKITGKLTGRLGGGLGYKLPTEFNEETESEIFRGIQPLNKDEMRAEKSHGANLDINYQTPIGRNMTFSVNQLFYYTRLNHPVTTYSDSTLGPLRFRNGVGTIDSRGIESNVKFTIGDFKLFFQYALIDALLDYDNINRQKPLTPRHNAGAVLMFEQHGKWRVGFESYYTGQQMLSDNTRTRDFWVIGLMGMREFEHFSLFLNFENFLDTRQTKYESIVTYVNEVPTFREIWAPTDGFVVNGGFIWKIFGSEEH